MIAPLWKECVKELTFELGERDINTYLRPLQAKQEGNGAFHLFAPNQFVLNWINNNCIDKIRDTLTRLREENIDLTIEIGSSKTDVDQGDAETLPVGQVVPPRLNPENTFDSFVEGSSNQMAYAAAMQVATTPKVNFNPLFLCGGVGLGKTHLMQAIGNEVLRRNPNAKVTYLTTERFVAEMVIAIRNGKMERFKEIYRSVDVLLVDDVQMFVGKKQSQDEFFNTFEELKDSGKIVLTSDSYPRDISGLEERLTSRFSGGLTQMIEPPEFETRVAILESKAEKLGCDLPEDVAHYIANHLRANVRELEGALRRVVANAEFSGGEVTLDFAKNALRDILAPYRRQLSLASIQKAVAEFYRLRTSDLTSARRSRSIVRPRQLAMALAKELTSHSLPEIGREFGGRDHTTVIHACRKITELKKEDPQIERDYVLLLRTLQH